MAERPVEHGAVRPLEMTHDNIVVLISSSPSGEKVIRQDRRDRDGCEQRGEDRDDVGDAQRSKQPPLDAG